MFACEQGTADWKHRFRREQHFSMEGISNTIEGDRDVDVLQAACLLMVICAHLKANMRKAFLQVWQARKQPKVGEAKVSRNADGGEVLSKVGLSTLYG